MSDEKLMELALQARESSYSPYSHFRVGAALLCADDSVYTGCNIENAAFTPGICAERTAIYKAVSEGKCAFTAIAIAGGSEDSAPALTAALRCLPPGYAGILRSGGVSDHSGSRNRGEAGVPVKGAASFKLWTG